MPGDSAPNAVFQRLPPWFRIGLGLSGRYREVKRQILDRNLHTVCQSARCPNRNECWNDGTATFLILGNLCSRRCAFCGVPKGFPHELDREEPARVAAAIAALSLSFVVITSVTRDDLEDGGASLFAETIHAIRAASPACGVEVLIPDFQGSEKALSTVLAAKPDILGHNIETVPSLYPRIRPQADYRRSLELLERADAAGMVAKTGLMLGLGENIDEVYSVLSDLQNRGCSILTLGQYLQPRKDHLPVKKYYSPGEFAVLRDHALNLGFRQVIAGPLVRSSYHAADYTLSAQKSGIDG